MPKSKWTYTGDVDVKYGGTFLDLSEPKYGIPTVRVSDLDSAIGYEDAYLIETGSIDLPGLVDLNERAQWHSMLSVCGYNLTDDNKIDDNAGGLFPVDSHDGLLLACDALLAYRGLEDASPHTVVIGKDAADSFRGWQSDHRLRAGASLENYVRKHFL